MEVFSFMNSSKHLVWMGSLGIFAGAVLLAVAIPAVLTGAETGAETAKENRAMPTAAPPPAAIQLPPGAEKAAKAIDRSSLEAPIRFLSDDLLEGRGPSS